MELPTLETNTLAVGQLPKKIMGTYRKEILHLPKSVHDCAGIEVFGHMIRSFVFTTDVMIAHNCDADAVLAVCPFTCQPVVIQALITAAERPVFAGVSGSTTSGPRSVELALFCEMYGMSGVVCNESTPTRVISTIASAVDIPVVVTVCELDRRAFSRVEAGASIINVAAGKETANIVSQLRVRYPEIPIMASSGPNEQSAASTIAAGADALSWTPPNMVDLERNLMAKCRNEEDG